MKIEKYYIIKRLIITFNKKIRNNKIFMILLPDEILLLILDNIDITEIIKLRVIDKQYYKCCNSILKKRCFNLSVDNIKFKYNYNKICISYKNKELIIEPGLFFSIDNLCKVGKTSCYFKMEMKYYNIKYYNNFINNLNSLFSYIFCINNKYISKSVVNNNISCTISNNSYYILNIFINEVSNIYNYVNNVKINTQDLIKISKEYNIYPIIQIKNLKKSGNIFYLNCVLKEGFIIFEDDMIDNDVKSIKDIYKNYKFILKTESIINENQFTRIKKVFDRN